MVSVLAIVYLVLGLLAFLLNAPVITIILYKRLMERDRRFIFILLMSTSDALFGILATSGYISEVANLEVELTFVIVLFYYTMESASVISLLLLTTHQYIRIRYPLHYPMMVTRKRLIYAAVLSLSLLIVDCVAYGVVLVLVIPRAQEYAGRIAFTTAVLHIMLPLTVLGVIQGRMLRIAYRHHRAINSDHPPRGIAQAAASPPQHNTGVSTPQTQDTSPSEHQHNARTITRAKATLEIVAVPPTQQQQDSSLCASNPLYTSTTHRPLHDSTQPENRANSSFRAAITVSILATSLIICWTPRIILSFITLFQQHSFYTPELRLMLGVSTALFLVNTVLNPLIYALRIKEIRAVVSVAMRKMKNCCS